MNQLRTPLDWQQISFRIAGFDRTSFINDITHAIPQDDTCQIAGLGFEGDGIQAKGWLTIRLRQPQRSVAVHERLRAVRGVVSVQTDERRPPTS